MFCGNCGTQNQDGVAFCANCGAPMAGEAQPVYQQDFQQEYQPMYQPEAPKKKNYLPIIIGAVAVVAVVILLIVLLGGGHGFSDPEDAALSFVEGSMTGDYDMCAEALHPDMLGDDDEEDFEEEVVAMLESMEVEADNFEVEDTEDIDEDRYDDYEENLKDEYDMDVEITDAKRVSVSYDISSIMGDNSTSMEVIVVEIDGDWYVYSS